ncbi:HEAT repeat domain-containing protein [Pseudobdellovibrio sp. HCB154]|uniref:HEAT repeat domain-containing protein n=1 Tax=Pseudobdellovibrio sp. HCB154 TaxID=3386277 RepID=UPI003916DC54
MKALSLLVFLFSVNVWSYVQSENDHSFTTQIARAKNQSLPMAQRWDALIKSAEDADGTQIKQVLEFAKSKDWYMRNALLVALDKVGTDLVYDKAKVLVSDKALVVRSAAVDILTRLESQEVRELLAKELNRNYNFVGKKSLWIRAQIMKNLVKKPYQSEREYFSKLLFDNDPEISAMSMQALEKISQVHFEGENALGSWKKFVKEQKWF